MEMFQDDEIGCVKVMNDVTFDWLETEDQPPPKTRNTSDQPLVALVLTPTRELAIQVKDHIEAVAMDTGIRVSEAELCDGQRLFKYKGINVSLIL